MAKVVNRVLLVLVSLLLTACGGRRGTKEIVFLTTSDIHGRIYDVDYVDSTKRSGSMLRVSTLLKELRNDNENVIYVDAGDVISGAADSYFDKIKDNHNVSLPGLLLEKMGCAAFVPGNHEFDFGVPTLDRFLNGGTFPVVCANIVYEDYDECFYQPYIIIEEGNLRIAIVGFSTASINYKIPTELINGLKVKSIVESAKYWIPYIQENEQPDLIIGLVHSGLRGGFVDDSIRENEVGLLAEQVAGFDAIFYGHDHIAHASKILGCQGDSVLLMNPGCHLQNVAVTKIQVTFEKRKVVSKTIEGNLVSLRDVEPDNELLNEISDRRESYLSYLDSVMGYTSVDLVYDGTPFVQTTAMDYLHNVMKSSMSSEITLILPVSGKNLKAGSFTPRDAVEFYPYENTMITFMLSGKEIDLAMEEGAKNYSFRTSKVIIAGGINYCVDLSKPINDRVQILSMADGTKFDDEKLYRVAMDSYLAYALDSPFINSFVGGRNELKTRMIKTTRSDLRYHTIIDHSLKQESGNQVTPIREGEWSVVN